jgi:nicotinamide mononucleotide adenylyltransferase
VGEWNVSKTAVLVAACGKFQPFHNEHLDYLLAALNEGEHCVVGITNPDPSYVRHEDSDPARSRTESNPATYYERFLMVTQSLCDAGISRDRFDVLPFPVNVPESWFNYFPRDALVLLTLYDDDPWLLERKARLEDHGLATRVLWQRPRKGITGADIRRRIIEGQPWRDLVPAATARVIVEYGIDERIRAAASGTPASQQS